MTRVARPMGKRNGIAKRKFASIISHYKMNSGGIKAPPPPPLSGAWRAAMLAFDKTHSQDSAERMPNSCVGP